MLTYSKPVRWAMVPLVFARLFDPSRALDTGLTDSDGARYGVAQHGPEKKRPMEVFTAAGFSALLQVIAIDLVLAGDNAIVIGLAAAGLPAEQRSKAILIGIIAATVLRIGFALITTQLLEIGGLLLSPAVCCCSGSAGRCTGSCASHATSWQRDRGAVRAATSTDGTMWPANAQDARPGERRRSSSPTCRCRSTTCWRWPAQRRSIRRC